jgi:hypothetical protein
MDIGFLSGDFAFCRGDSWDGPASELIVPRRMGKWPDRCDMANSRKRMASKKRRIVDPITGFHVSHVADCLMVTNYACYTILLYYTMQC